MSNSTFLITNRGMFTIKQTRIGLISLGFIMVIFNVMVFLETRSISNVNPFLVVLGISFIITGTVGLSKNSKFSPKVFLNDEFIYTQII